jgi:hypothetical protein
VFGQHIDLLDSNAIEFIKEYQQMAIGHIKKNKKKYSAAENFETLLIDFAEIKIKFISEMRKKHGDDVITEFFLSQQIFVAGFFGIGCDESVESHIENGGLFWGNYLFLLKRNEFPTFHIQYYAESIGRSNRSKFSSESKFIAHEIQEHIEGLFVQLFQKQGFDEPSYRMHLMNLKKKLYMLVKESRAKYKSAKGYLQKKINGKQHLLVYRGFSFGEKEFVRQGLYLKENPTAHVQMTGAGLSFSLDKKIAQNFALARWRGVWKATWEKRVNWDRILLKLANINVENMVNSESEKRYAAIGTYKIPVGKIIAYMCQEEEIVVLPEHIEKFRYDIIKTIK